MTKANPWDVPGWLALAREAKLIRQLIGSGVTALGKANYADGKGNYYLGFFGLSIGLERLAKLTLVADFAIEHGGRLPEESLIRGFGHQLVKLLDMVEKLSSKYDYSGEYGRPIDPISSGVVACLDSFANAQQGRYANFRLGDPNFEAEFEPIRIWWEKVTEPILAEHFYGKAVEDRIRHRAKQAAALMGGYTLILYFGEDGKVIDDLEDASFRTGVTEFSQKYWRYYSLTTVRWVSEIFEHLSHLGCYERDIDVLFGHYEHFLTFTVEDSLLKSRKTWPA